MSSPVFNPGKPVPSLPTPGSPTFDPDKPVPHLTTPEGAIQVFKAEGDFGDKVAVAAFSVSNFGVFASSKEGVGLVATGAELAAAFDGSITVSGTCEVIGTLHTQGNLDCDGNLHTKGDHIVDGDIQLAGADYAEDFDILNLVTAEPGTVMVLDDSGAVRVCDKAYDRRVAGVISGAGDYKPAVILDRQVAGADRRPLALMGKVYCRVDASNIPIAIGDLLTTSSMPGHAMKAANPTQAFGAVIGKALRPLAGGCGLIPILVALQ
jgi:hypothetical protein